MGDDRRQTWRRGWGWIAPLLTLQSLALHAEEPDVDVGGYVAAGIDHYQAFYDADGDAQTTRGVLRSAKLELELDWGNHWSAEIDANLKVGGGDPEGSLGDAYVRYRGEGGLETTLGRFKEPFGLERLSSYANISTSERSVATSAFAPGRSQGVMVGQFRQSLTWSVGAFTEEPEGGSAHAVTGRITAASSSDQQTLHIGVAGSWRDLDGEPFQIKDRGEVFSADNVLRSPRFEARDSALVGLEGAWLRGRLSVTGELLAQQVTRENGEHWRFGGAYVQTGVFLTDHRRRYRRGGLKAPNSVGGTGALELVGRYSAVDLRDRGIGAEATIALVGINYYLGEQLQLRLNWLIPDIEGNRLMANADGDALTLRVVYRF